VIAEGIETRSQQAFLELQGCDEGQGHLISRPLAASDLEALLRANAVVDTGVRGPVPA
jgi:EAL domain-containing protein (putative c-di-GMP-specific phosphodiesterase class I)